MDPLETNLDEFLIQNLTESSNETTSSGPSEWHQFGIAMEMTSAICASVGCVANMIIIWIIAKNAKIQSRTNILILNFAICDFVFTFATVIVASALADGVNIRTYEFIFCFMYYFDTSLHFNESIIMTVLITNTLFKNMKIKTSHIVVALYAVISASFLIHMISCCSLHFRGLYVVGALMYIINLFILFSKEFNSCYKTHRVGDPLSKQTNFRLNIGRIYCYNYFILYAFAIFIDLFFAHLYYWYLLVNITYFTSVYILIYLVIYDRNYYECFFKMLKCQRGDASEDGLDDLAEMDCKDSTPPYDVLSEQLEPN